MPTAVRGNLHRLRARFCAHHVLPRRNAPPNLLPPTRVRQKRYNEAPVQPKRIKTLPLSGKKELQCDHSAANITTQPMCGKNMLNKASVQQKRITTHPERQKCITIHCKTAPVRQALGKIFCHLRLEGFACTWYYNAWLVFPPHGHFPPQCWPTTVTGQDKLRCQSGQCHPTE